MAVCAALPKPGRQGKGALSSKTSRFYYFFVGVFKKRVDGATVKGPLLPSARAGSVRLCQVVSKKKLKKIGSTSPGSNQTLTSPSPPELWMTMLCSLPVCLSLAPTCKMPSASMSNETSICGTPLSKDHTHAARQSTANQNVKHFGRDRVPFKSRSQRVQEGVAICMASQQQQEQEQEQNF